jgi:putative DNA primase/helicase
MSHPHHKQDTDTGPQSEPGPTPIEKGWKDRLKYTGKGTISAGVGNVLIALRCAPEWQGVLSFDQSSLHVIATAPPWNKQATATRWEDSDDVRTAAWLHDKEIFATPETVSKAVHTSAHDHCFHPIRDYLDSLRWDKESRLDSWLLYYLGAGDDSMDDSALEYVCTVGKKFMIGAVARIYDPGCKVDTCLILEGPQGLRKSTSLRVLYDPWFTDEMPELGTKDAALQLRGIWLVELSELEALYRTELARIKSFLSRQKDRFRPPYGRHTVEFPRETVFAGTVNHGDYLKDESGERRFWPVKCGATIKIEELTKDRDQLWAEAVAKYRKSETWWLDSQSAIDAATEEQQERYNADAWDNLIAQFIAFYNLSDVSIDQILIGCLCKEKSKWTQGDKNRIARSLKGLKWERYKAGPRTEREWRYRRKSENGATPTVSQCPSVPVV